jgi:hypothetical protein
MFQGSERMLAAIGNYAGESMGAFYGAVASVAGAAASVAAAHPLLATVVTIGAYELFGGSSNNPDHLGNNIDVKA